MMKRSIRFGVHPFIRDHAPALIYKVAIGKPSVYRAKSIFVIPFSVGKEPGARFRLLSHTYTFST